MSSSPETMQLGSATLDAYVQHVAASEAGMSGTLQPDGPFLWCRGSNVRDQRVAAGKAIAEPAGEDAAIAVPDGLIHDWIGAARIPGATVANTLALLQDYERHKDVYAPDVADSRLVRRSDDAFQIYLRLRKKKVVTVVLDTDHDVQYEAISPSRWCCSSRTTRIAEVKHPGKGNEHVEEPDTGYGYLWRLASYWRLEEYDGGVLIECRAISLTRDIPKALAWIIEPIVMKLPRESLIATLEATRRGYGARFIDPPSRP